MIRSPLITVMTDAVTKAARSLRRDFGEVENLQVSRKGPANFVSAADTRAEEILRGALEKARPGYGFVCEESGTVEGTDKAHRWHIDPLDGTTNFLHGIPHFCVSVGLEREGVPVAGVIFDPIKDEMFIAERGKGAFLNNRRLRVAARRDMEDAVIYCGLPHLGRPAHRTFLAELTSVMTVCAGLRRYGAAALDLAYVAAGRADAFWERDLQTWDMAAGLVIVKEAGGYVSDCDGKEAPLETGSVCAGNDHIQPQLLALLKKAGRPATPAA